MNDNDNPNDENPTPAGEDRPQASDEATGLEPIDAGTSSGAEDGAQPEGLAELTRERDELRDMLLRRRAEFENFRRRTDREKAQWAADAEADVMQALVPTLDHLEQALQAEGEGDALREGVELIHRDLLAALERLGLAVHNPAGRRFDPSTDQALAYEPVPGQTEGTVVEVFRKGYLYKDRLIRPALVKVAGAHEEEGDEAGVSKEADDAVH